MSRLDRASDLLCKGFRAVAGGARGLAAVFFPRRCPACDRRDDSPGPPDVCASCSASVVRIAGRGCRRCGGEPAPGAAVAPSACRRCRGRRFAFRRASSAVRYSGAAREVVLAVKFRRRREGLDVLARWMEAHVRASIGTLPPGGHGVVVAAPLHPTRRFARGFDQAEELADCFARRLGLRRARGAIRRGRRTRPQALARPGERREAVVHAFQRGASWRRVRDRNVILVDDVISTGATADQATRALLACGARAVWVVTAAT